MKKLFLFCAAVMTFACCQAAQKVDEFTTKSGKKVTITCIKHASMEINYNGVEIQVDPVGMWLKPETDYATFPKANIILITHEHKDHFDREAIHQIRTPATAIYVNQAVFGHFKNGLVMKNGEKVQYADDISIEAVPLYLPITRRLAVSSSTLKVATMATYSPSTDCASTSPAIRRTFRRWRISRISTLHSCPVTSPTR